MTFIEKTDRITIDDLRCTGATKWSVQDDLIGAFVAEMDFGIAPVITEALHEIVEQGAFGYLPTRFTAELRAATAQMLQARYDWTIEPADVRVVPDVIKALELAIEHHSRAGSKIIVPTPSYMPFLSIPPMMGRGVIEVPMLCEDGHYALDMAGIQEAFDQGGNLLILCNPYNPVGRVFSNAELEAVAELVERNGGRVFSDEIWAPLTYAGNRHLPYASVNAVAAGHAITALSASKAWNLPGLKCAQVVTSNDADRAIWNKIGFFAAHGTANLGVVANAVAYREGFPWLEDVVAYLDRNRRAMADLVHDLLPGVRYHIPEGTYVGWLDFRGSAVAENPGAFFKEKAGVYLTEGVTCGKDFAGFARFIFATPLPIMQEAMVRISKAMKAL